MCGILGIIGKQISESDLGEILKLMSHRGPDSYGIWQNLESSVSLGHRRLSIIDLSPGGHQPMVSSNERFVISFNGEIYNFLQLKEQLSFKSWRGHSDTEVMLQCFTEWGIEATLKKLKGMFAFALFDKENGEVIFARDRFGEKPLYLGKLGEGIFFSSELRPFYSLIEKEINPESLSYFFELGYIPHPHTIFKNVFKLPPGTYLKCKVDKPQIKISEAKSYWDFDPKSVKKIDITYEEALKTFEASLKKVVSDQMISDVPLGAFLSGGVDSSLIVSIAQSVSSRPLKTFSLGIKDQVVNEAVFAKKIAQYLKTDHHEFYVTPQEIIDLGPSLINAFDEPFSDPSAIPTWIVAKLAREKVTVALSGDAGDELFGGYKSYQRTEMLMKYKRLVPGFLLKPNLVPNITYKELGFKARKAMDVLKLEGYQEIFASLTTHSSHLVLKDKRAPLFGRNLFEQSREGAMWWDANYYMSDDILVKVDRMSMKHSLEVRVPLLDHELVEWIWSLPRSYRFTDDRSKVLMKDLLYQYVPRELVDRPKTGFGLPLATWLRKDLRDWAQSVVFNPSEADNYLDQGSIKKLWDEHQSGHKDHKYILWNVISFKSWFASFK